MEKQHSIGSETVRQEAVSVSLRKHLEAVNSVQRMSSVQTSTARLNAEVDHGALPKYFISEDNIDVAKMAIRDRSPSYLNQKLVSSTSVDGQTSLTKV